MHHSNQSATYKGTEICSLYLQKALDNDPDLAGIPREALANIFQVLSLFQGATIAMYLSSVFMNAFYQHSTFITGGQEEGYLCDINEDEEIRKVFFAFIRLIGTLYFKKHLSTFVILRPECADSCTTLQLYN